MDSNRVRTLVPRRPFVIRFRAWSLKLRVVVEVKFLKKNYSRLSMRSNCIDTTVRRMVVVVW